MLNNFITNVAVLIDNMYFSSYAYVLFTVRTYFFNFDISYKIYCLILSYIKYYIFKTFYNVKACIIEEIK